MSVERRVSKCEQALGMGAGGLCECVRVPPDIRVWRPDEPEPSREPVVCERCGKPRQVVVIKVVYDEPLSGGEADDAGECPDCD